MALVDLSHTIRDGLVTYPGLPAPRISDHLSRAASRRSYAPGTEFHIARIEMVANTGTYLDSPAHRWADGADLSGLALERLADLPGVVVDLPRGARAFTARDLPAADLTGRAVLLRTGWSAHFGTPRYFEAHPFLAGDAAEALARRGAGRHRLAEHRRHVGRRAARALAAAARRRPDRRAPDEPRGASRAGLPLLRGAAARRRDGHLPGARLRGRALKPRREIPVNRSRSASVGGGAPEEQRNA